MYSASCPRRTARCPGPHGGSVDLTLDICNRRVSGGDPASLMTDDKVHKGRFLHKQDHARYYERAKLIVRATKPAAFTADRELVPGPVARSCGTCAEHGCLDCSCGPSSQLSGTQSSA